MKHKLLLFVILVIILVQLSSFALAEEGDDLEFFGLEAEKLLNLGSGLLATGLFILTLIAYKRTNRKRLLYVSLAFLLFAAKGFLTSEELFFKEWSWVDPTASFLNFVIMLSFFYGVIKKWGENGIRIPYR